MGTLRARHDVLGGLSFSPDGRRLAAAGIDGAIRLWEAATGKLLAVCSGHTPNVNSFCFSSDGKTLASGSEDKTIRLWDVASGKERRRLTGHKSGVFAVVLSPDGRWLVSCDVYDIRFWRTDTGEQTRVLRMTASAPGIWSLDLSPDGKTLAVCFRERPIGLWDVTTLKELPQFDGTDTVHEHPFFLRDGQHLLTLGTEAITLREVATGKKVRRFGGVRGYLGESVPIREMEGPFAVSPDGSTLATGDGHHWSNYAPIHLWDLASGKELRQLHGHQNTLYSLAFAPDNKTLVSLGGDNTLRRWDLKTGRELDQPVGHQNAVNAVAFSPDGKILASGSSDRTVRLWNARTGREIRSFEADHEIVRGIAFSLEGDILLSRNEVLPPGKRASEFVTKDQALTRIRLWDVTSGRPRRYFDVRADDVRCACLSADRQVMALGGEFVRFLDLGTGRLERMLGGPFKQLGSAPVDISAVAYSPEGFLLTVDAGHSATLEALRLILSDVGTRKKVWEHWEKAQTLKEVAFSPDGKIVATGGSEVHLWDARSGKRIGALEGATGCVVFSHDGKTLATCFAGDSAVLWEVSTRKQRRRFLGLQGIRNSERRPYSQYPVSCMAFSPNDRLLATGGEDTLLTVWKLTDRGIAGVANNTRLDVLWTDLADVDAIRGYNALWELVSMPEQAIEFLNNRLPVAAETDAKRVARLIADLGDAKFVVREKATTEIETLGTVAAAGLQACLKHSPSPEVRRRAERILPRIRRAAPTLVGQERIRALRWLETLEQIGTPKAEDALRTLADWGRDEWFRNDATASLDRLSKRIRP